MSTLLSLDNAVCACFAFYITVMVVKIMCLVLATAYYRTIQKIPMEGNKEDLSLFPKGVKTVARSDELDRVRRIHANALENIPLFVFVGAVYVLINPQASVAIWHFRVYAFSRIGFTIAYFFGLQPYRSMMFMTGVFAMVSMVVQIFLYAPW